MNRPNPDLALEQFSEYLKRSGVSTKQLTLARHFLRHLLSTLRELNQDGNGYRTAAETTLRNFPDEASFIDLVREFYPYWSGEAVVSPTTRPNTPQPAGSPAATVTAATSTAGLSGGVAAPGAGLGVTYAPTTLNEAMARMEADPWSQRTIVDLERQLHHVRSLGRYGDELRRAGIDEANAASRIRLVKLLLYQIRDAPQNTDSYRAGVDKVLALFPNQDSWHVYVSLAREFFYFLANDPEAASKLQKQIGATDLLALMAG